MDLLRQLEAAVAYLESNLRGEIDLDRLAQLACVTKDSFLRFFSYMTGMTVTEYIRRRRLTLAAEELRGSRVKIIDLAVRYGWDSTDAFTKAFKRQHGITPTQARGLWQRVKAYPPASFHIVIKGAKEMDFRILQLEDMEVWGISQPFAGQGYQTEEELRNKMWSVEYDDVPAQICEGGWNHPRNRSRDGCWYGIWQNGKYLIARTKNNVQENGLERSVIPAGTYAAFQTGRGGLAWEELPKLKELVVDSWLPSSGYRQTEERLIEAYHLWTDQEERKKNRFYEIWIPVSKAD